ncbi:putative polysaccharide biosynthesis protein [Pontibacillus litoralis]|uniref:Low temperature requirement B protein n=1 Tax=Pontibacillus litoralis JSM 072002 TaxID=1385512 RepID=A0A0A5G0A0_9BACI|nr:polysaccharide biosynthesis protein [Pontibacillus litoralis]KGX85484.1 low temperature requirement B protein [Pontibacillus litoralis JSM 072002]
MEHNASQKNFFKGALLLTLAGLISKILSAGYRIPLQNIAGDVGFYIYQQVYPFLGMAWVISIYGFPVAISTLVAQRRSLSIRGFFMPVFFLLLSISVLFFAVCYIGAPFIAHVMGDDNLVMPLRVAASVFLFLPFTSLLRGVFQGLNDMGPTAYSQMLEQFVRVLIIIVGTVYFVRSGYSLYHVGAGAAVGSVIGAIVATVYLSYVAWVRIPARISHADKQVSFVYTAKIVIVVGLFICINYMMLLFIQLGDALTMVASLERLGMEFVEAQKWKGIFDRGYPLIQLGTVIGSSLALSLVPSITKQRLENKEQEVYNDAYRAMRFSFIFASAATIGLIIVLPSVNKLFFDSQDGTMALQLLALVILFGSVALTSSSLLQGIGKVKTPAIMVVIGFVLKIALNSWLVSVYGIYGGAVASVLAILAVCIGNSIALYKEIGVNVLTTVPWKQLIASLCAMGIAVVVGEWGYEQLFTVQSRLDYVGYTLVNVVLGMGVFLLMLLRTGIFAEKDLEGVPLGEKLMLMAKRR